MTDFRLWIGLSCRVAFAGAVCRRLGTCANGTVRRIFICRNALIRASSLGFSLIARGFSCRIRSCSVGSCSFRLSCLFTLVCPINEAFSFLVLFVYPSTS